MKVDATRGPAISAVPGLPQALQEEGPVAAQLRRALLQELSPAAFEVHRRVVADLGFLRSTYRQWAQGVRGTGRPVDPANYECLVCLNWMIWTQTDFVLRYSVAHLERLELADRVHDQARDAYLRTPDAYDQVLGHLIPADIRASAHELLGRQAYAGCRNATAAKDWPLYKQELELRRERRVCGLTTGLLPGLDAALGGLCGLTVVAGHQGVGKTSLALAMALGVIQRHADVGVLFYSLDQPKRALYDRLVCQRADIAQRRLISRSLTDQECETLAQTHALLEEDTLPRLRVIDREGLPHRQTLSASLFRHHSQELLETAKAQVVLTVVDSFRLLGVPDTLRSERDADRFRADLLRELQENTPAPQEPAGPPFVVTTSVREPGCGRRGPLLADITGSPDLPHAADSVLLMQERSNVHAPPGTDLLVALEMLKGRDGAEEPRIDLTFNAECCQFTEVPTLPERTGKDGSRPATEAAGGHRP